MPFPLGRFSLYLLPKDKSKAVLTPKLEFSNHYTAGDLNVQFALGNCLLSRNSRNFCNPSSVRDPHVRCPSNTFCPELFSSLCCL